MATKKTTTKPDGIGQLSASTESSNINAAVIDALRLLQAAGVLEQSDDGWSYTTPAYLTLPDDKLTHWASGRSYE